MNAKSLIAAFVAVSYALSATAQGHEPNLPWADFSNRTDHQVVISAGTPELYNGHPTTVLMADGRTMFCTWSENHGGPAAFIGVSRDGGLTWQNSPAPKEWKGLINCPSIYRLTDKAGRERLFVFATMETGKGYRNMAYSVSEDGGISWSPVKDLGKPCVMAFTSIVRLKNGDYLGMYHLGNGDQDRNPLKVWQSVSHDGGLTWGEPEMVAEKPELSPCEPCVFRSPDEKTLICIMRENRRRSNSLYMGSKDEGKTWTPMHEGIWGLTGDRHIMRYLPDGRMIFVFRDMAPGSPTKGHFVAWVGKYSDLTNGLSGQYRVKLLHSYAGWDCGYPGLEILPDGTIVATTYIKMHPGPEKHSVVSVRFRIEDLDALFSHSL